MRKVMMFAAAAALCAAAQPAFAGNADGKLQIKLLGTAVLPDGKIDKVFRDDVGLPAGTQTAANDNVVPTIAIEYFFSPSLSVETICCLTQHDVDGTTGMPGAELVSNAKLIPATLTLKYHVDAGPVKPYVGAGPALFLFIDEHPGAATAALGVNGFKLSDDFGVALQAGVDIPLNAKGLAVSLDAKRYFVGTTARWFVDGAEVLSTRHKLDPWVLSAGLALRF